MSGLSGINQQRHFWSASRASRQLKLICDQKHAELRQNSSMLMMLSMSVSVDLPAKMSAGCLHRAGDRPPFYYVPRFGLGLDGVCFFTSERRCPRAIYYTGTVV